MKTKLRTTCVQFEIVVPSEVELRITFYVSAVRREVTGYWMIVTVRPKDAALYFDADDGTAIVPDGFTVALWAKRRVAHLDGMVRDMTLIEMLDRKEAEDDANGKSFVPC